ncbi:class I SAM-dependent methyltransferase [bacterium]|nr:class I SAM-dependent methyltransferase [bacterium]
MNEYICYPFLIKIDIKLFFSYFFLNPYRAVRKHLERKGERSPHQYGETPVKVIEKLIKASGGINKYQYFVDLGAGRGRVCAFVQKIFGCKVFAFEQLRVFVKKGKKLFPKVHFTYGNFLDQDLKKFDLIYLYGTMMKEKEIVAFTQKVGQRTRVITISYPLTDYDSRFKVINEVEVEFPWGKTKGYIQKLRG